ncbi:hypothetical protein TetV_292 [Tetraselmis virus 1]|uniref:Uncharacterized protein n=1 Tax=Tetraselmis virus 1 TaxID=2060617 RepID=A0A2P0VNA4_9VIRU|nr:hypothetical protein QJ968_gp292 [Tetraselmis virus 1]AUF82384.1 hypothetical protein TetV_292 [Tetraselmis virus 1]
MSANKGRASIIILASLLLFVALCSIFKKKKEEFYPYQLGDSPQGSKDTSRSVNRFDRYTTAAHARYSKDLNTGYGLPNKISGPIDVVPVNQKIVNKDGSVAVNKQPELHDDGIALTRCMNKEGIESCIQYKIKNDGSIEVTDNQGNVSLFDQEGDCLKGDCSVLDPVTQLPVDWPTELPPSWTPGLPNNNSGNNGSNNVNTGVNSGNDGNSGGGNDGNSGGGNDGNSGGGNDGNNNKEDNGNGAGNSGNSLGSRDNDGRNVEENEPSTDNSCKMWPTSGNGEAMVGGWVFRAFNDTVPCDYTKLTSDPISNILECKESCGGAECSGVVVDETGCYPYEESGHLSISKPGVVTHKKIGQARGSPVTVNSANGSCKSFETIAGTPAANEGVAEFIGYEPCNYNMVSFAGSGLIDPNYVTEDTEIKLTDGANTLACTSVCKSTPDCEGVIVRDTGGMGSQIACAMFKQNPDKNRQLSKNDKFKTIYVKSVPGLELSLQGGLGSDTSIFDDAVLNANQPHVKIWDQYNLLSRIEKLFPDGFVPDKTYTLMLEGSGCHDTNMVMLNYRSAGIKGIDDTLPGVSMEVPSNRIIGYEFSFDQNVFITSNELNTVYDLISLKSTDGRYIPFGVGPDAQGRIMRRSDHDYVTDLPGLHAHVTDARKLVIGTRQITNGYPDSQQALDWGYGYMTFVGFDELALPSDDPNDIKSKLSLSLNGVNFHMKKIGTYTWEANGNDLAWTAENIIDNMNVPEKRTDYTSEPYILIGAGRDASSVKPIYKVYMDPMQSADAGQDITGYMYLRSLADNDFLVGHHKSDQNQAELLEPEMFSGWDDCVQHFTGQIENPEEYCTQNYDFEEEDEGDKIEITEDVEVTEEQPRILEGFVAGDDLMTIDESPNDVVFQDGKPSEYGSFKLVDTQKGKRLQMKDTNKCLGSTDSTSISLLSCDDDETAWIQTPNPDGSFHLMHESSKKYAVNDGTGNLKLIGSYTNAPNQKFMMTSFASDVSQTMTLMNMSNYKCLNYDGLNKNPYSFAECMGGLDQQFTFEESPQSNDFKIRDYGGSGKCLAQKNDDIISQDCSLSGSTWRRENVGDYSDRFMMRNTKSGNILNYDVNLGALKPFPGRYVNEDKVSAHFMLTTVSDARDSNLYLGADKYKLKRDHDIAVIASEPKKIEFITMNDMDKAIDVKDESLTREVYYDERLKLFGSETSPDNTENALLNGNYFELKGSNMGDGRRKITLSPSVISIGLRHPTKCEAFLDTLDQSKWEDIRKDSVKFSCENTEFINDDYKTDCNEFKKYCETPNTCQDFLNATWTGNTPYDLMMQNPELAVDRCKNLDDENCEKVKEMCRFPVSCEDHLSNAFSPENGEADTTQLRRRRTIEGALEYCSNTNDFKNKVKYTDCGNVALLCNNNTCEDVLSNYWPDDQVMQNFTNAKTWCMDNYPEDYGARLPSTKCGIIASMCDTNIVNLPDQKDYFFHVKGDDHKCMSETGFNSFLRHRCKIVNGVLCCRYAVNLNQKNYAYMTVNDQNKVIYTRDLDQVVECRLVNIGVKNFLAFRISGKWMYMTLHFNITEDFNNAQDIDYRPGDHHPLPYTTSKFRMYPDFGTRTYGEQKLAIVVYGHHKNDIDSYHEVDKSYELRHRNSKGWVIYAHTCRPKLWNLWDPPKNLTDDSSGLQHHLYDHMAEIATPSDGEHWQYFGKQQDFISFYRADHGIVNNQHPHVNISGSRRKTRVATENSPLPLPGNNA